MERRPLRTAMHSVPNADPEAVRQFVTQDRLPPTTAAEQVVCPAPPSTASPLQPNPLAMRSTATAPVGLIPVTVRLRPELAGALKRASLERQLVGEPSFTQQELVAHALEPWLRERGYLG